VGESSELGLEDVEDLVEELEDVDRRRSTNMTGIASREDEELDR
jgi:hypothetical protein